MACAAPCALVHARGKSCPVEHAVCAAARRCGACASLATSTLGRHLSFSTDPCNAFGCAPCSCSRWDSTEHMAVFKLRFHRAYGCVQVEIPQSIWLCSRWDSTEHMAVFKVGFHRAYGCVQGGIPQSIWPCSRWDSTEHMAVFKLRFHRAYGRVQGGIPQSISLCSS